MVRKQLINPRSIVVVGGSNDIKKPGGKILKNIMDGGFKGKLYVTNLKEDEVQGIKSYKDINDLPEVDLAILAIPAQYTLDAVKILTEKKNTKAFIVISAGFSEVDEKGKDLENKLVAQINQYDASLIGPNCIGVLTPQYHGVFTLPIPKLEKEGADLISGSGATACFIMESGIQTGLKFSNVISVGNSAQMGVEDVLKYLDEHFDPEKDSKVKLLYMESIEKPQILLKHAASLIRKGCKIAAIKAGSSEAGSRAASSHTGALATPDEAVEALFRKAGIIRCYSREELISVAAILMYPPLKGKNIAVITHAGGPAVMLTDALSKGGLAVPAIEGKKAEALKEHLFPGSSVRNPIDFLATGTAEQLGVIIDYVENDFDHIDGMVVIFGTPGLFPIFDVYDLLHEKMQTCKKPIYPVLPSVTTAVHEIEHFIEHGRINFSDELILGHALAKVYQRTSFAKDEFHPERGGIETIRKIITSSGDGYLSPQEVSTILDAAGIARIKEKVVKTVEEMKAFIGSQSYPLVMKVVGPVHKTDVGGVRLDIRNMVGATQVFEELMAIKGAEGVLVQPMISGLEIFIGAKREENFGHLVMAGLGGIFVEVLEDVNSALVPVGFNEAKNMITKLKGYKLLDGIRGKKGVDIDTFANIIISVSKLLEMAPEIVEMDINPLMGIEKEIIAVDARIKIDHNML